MLYSYNAYKDKVMEILQDELGTESVWLISVPKNNGVVLDGVRLNMGADMASPVLYFNEKQEVFDDTDVETFVEGTVKFFNSKNTFPTDTVMAIRDWNIAKDNLRARVVNYETNKEFLADKPFVRFLDLAVVFQVSMEGILSCGEEGLVTVNNTIQNCWGVDIDTLHMEAMKNLEQSNYSVRSMRSLLDIMIFDDDNLADEMLCVATTYEGQGGAAVILSPVVLNEACKKMGSNKIYILPSSIHEILLIDCEKAELTDLRTMVKEVNDSIVQPQEVLSNTVYVFENSRVDIA